MDVGAEQGSWRAQHALGGHFGPVVDLSWGLGGSCLISVSADQTARIHAPHRGHWCEIARPQVSCLFLTYERPHFP